MVDEGFDLYIFTISVFKNFDRLQDYGIEAILIISIFDHFCLQKLQSFARLWLMKDFWSSFLTIFVFKNFNRLQDYGWQSIFDQDYLIRFHLTIFVFKHFNSLQDYG